jgi:hypothetical protein
MIEELSKGISIFINSLQENRESCYLETEPWLDLGRRCWASLHCHAKEHRLLELENFVKFGSTELCT